jgi:hypothetical protein
MHSLRQSTTVILPAPQKANKRFDMEKITQRDSSENGDEGVATIEI